MPSLCSLFIFVEKHFCEQKVVEAASKKRNEHLHNDSGDQSMTMKIESGLSILANITIDDQKK